MWGNANLVVIILFTLKNVCYYKSLLFIKLIFLNDILKHKVVHSNGIICAVSIHGLIMKPGKHIYLLKHLLLLHSKNIQILPTLWDKHYTNMLISLSLNAHPEEGLLGHVGSWFYF